MGEVFAVFHQTELFQIPVPTPESILAEALALNPRAIFVGFSGGDDSLATAHWMMKHVPNCEVLHINTGIGIERTRQFVRETCAAQGWALTEIRAKEDCGQDYDELVKRYGFPGPSHHRKMQNRLKGRAIEKLLRDRKLKRSDKIMIATGIRQDESQRRSGYGGREINFQGSQMWVNPLYWRTKAWFMDYIREHKLPRNPVSKILGMSGECLCGAFASPGEKALVRIVCPVTANRLDQLEIEVRAAGHNWGWEEHPPRQAVDDLTGNLFMPLCVGCEKAP